MSDRVHPKAEGIARIRIRHPHPAGQPAEILAVYCDGTEDMVGEAVRTRNAPGSSAGWRANLRASHPSLAEGRVTWAGRSGDLAEALTESVKAKGPWWE